MKKQNITLKMLSLLTFAVLITIGSAAHAQTVPSFPPLTGGKSVTHPASYYKPVPTNYVGVNKKTRISAVDAWSDPATGAHGSMTHFDYGFVSPVHTHTYDYYGVTIKGVMENYEVGVKPVKLGPGSYWYQVGKKAHTTACLTKGGCLVFLVQAAKFDAQVPPKED